MKTFILIIFVVVVQGSDPKARVKDGVVVPPSLKPITGPHSACSNDMIETSKEFKDAFVEKLAKFAADMIRALGEQNTEMIIEKTAKFGGESLSLLFNNLQTKINGMT